MRSVLVPPQRWARWVENFERSHGAASLETADGALVGRAVDGSTFRARLPFGRRLDAGEEPTDDLAAPPADWGVLLVRRGGFAVARLAGGDLAASKVGQRHVQGRTKAGGQSQQRFARRRSNQARVAFDAAADHAVRLLADPPVDLPVVVGGDRDGVAAVLADPRLERLRVVGPWLAVAEPRRAVLDQAVVDAGSLQVEVENAEGPPIDR